MDEKYYKIIKRLKSGDLEFFFNLDYKYRNDITIATIAVSRDPNDFCHLGDIPRKNHVLCIMALLYCSSLIDCVHPELLKDPKFIIEAIMVGVTVEKFPSYTVWDRETALHAVSIDGNNIKHLPSKFRNDHEVIVAAFLNQPKSLSPSLMNDEKLVVRILQSSPKILEVMPERHFDNYRIMNIAIVFHPWKVRKLGPSLMKNHQMCAELFVSGDTSFRDTIPSEYFSDYKFLNLIAENRMYGHPRGELFLQNIKPYLPFEEFTNLKSWIKGHIGNDLKQYNNDYDMIISYS